MPECRILFWNLDRRELRSEILAAVESTEASIVAFAECPWQRSETLSILRDSTTDFYLPTALDGRLQVFSRRTSLNLTEVHSADRLSLRRLVGSDRECLLGFVHLADKRNNDVHEQTVEATLLASEVRRVERRMGHDRTILVGDFNLNPFDPGMTKGQALNAMMTVQCIERGIRTVHGREYSFFYNPMWGLHGDRTNGPPGTFHHQSSTSGHFGWNMLDQVLVRPAALQDFADVAILDSVGDTRLSTRTGRPRGGSGHFPILVSLR